MNNFEQSRIKQMRLHLTVLGVDTSLMTDDEVKQLAAKIANAFYDTYVKWTKTFIDTFLPAYQAAQDSFNKRLADAIKRIEETRVNEHA